MVRGAVRVAGVRPSVGRAANQSASARMAPGALGLRERAVRDRADDLGRERVVVAVERSTSSRPSRWREGIVDVDRVTARGRERPDRVDRSRSPRRPRSPRGWCARPRRSRRAGRDEAVQRRGELAGLDHRRRVSGASSGPHSRSSAASSSTKNGLPPLRSWSTATSAGSTSGPSSSLRAPRPSRRRADRGRAA